LSFEAACLLPSVTFGYSFPERVTESNCYCAPRKGFDLGRSIAEVDTATGSAMGSRRRGTLRPRLAL